MVRLAWVVVACVACQARSPAPPRPVPVPPPPPPPASIVEREHIELPVLAKPALPGDVLPLPAAPFLQPPWPLTRAPVLSPHLVFAGLAGAAWIEHCDQPLDDRELTQYRQAWCRILVRHELANGGALLVRLAATEGVFQRPARDDLVDLLVEQAREPVAALAFLRAKRLDDTRTLDTLAATYAALGRRGDALHVYAALDQRIDHPADRPGTRCLRILAQLELTSGDRQRELARELSRIGDTDSECDLVRERVACPVVSGAYSPSIGYDLQRCDAFIGEQFDRQWRVLALVVDAHWPSSRDPADWLRYAADAWQGRAADGHAVAALENAVRTSDCTDDVLRPVTRLAAEMARALPRWPQLKTFATMDPVRCRDFKRHVKSSP